jgi:DNA-binding IclR family transcriptional regulator
MLPYREVMSEALLDAAPRADDLRRPVQQRTSTGSTTSPDKVLSIIDLFSPERPSWTVDEAAAELGLSESTAYRYFRSLSACGLVFTVRPGHYLLGPGIIQYERRLRISDPLIRHAQPVMAELAAQYSVPGVTFISRMFRQHVMSMYEVPLAKQALTISYDRGRLMPMFVGAPAMAILAFSPIRNVQRAFMQRPDRGSPAADRKDWLDVKREMRRVRQVEHAVDRSQVDQGIAYLSVPLRGQADEVIGSLTLACAEELAGTAFCEQTIARLHAANTTIKQGVGAEMAAEDARRGRSR